MKNPEAFLRVNVISEYVNAIGSLRTFMYQSKEDYYHLKWSIIAAHISLQTLMVIALKGTSNLEVIKWDKKKYANKTQYEILSDPKAKLDNFLDLFSKIVRKGYLNNSEISHEVDDITTSIILLNDIRNQFIHFLPAAWSIQVDLLKEALLSTIKVQKVLLKHCSKVTYCFEDLDPNLIIDLLEECEKNLT